MLCDEETAGVEYEHSEIWAEAVNFFSAVSTEHSGANDDDIECNAAVRRHLIPSAASIAAQNIDRERSILNLYRLIRFD